MTTPENLLEQYYAQTASTYNQSHISDKIDSEHDFALMFLSSLIDDFNITSILDIGSGTGRALSYLKRKHPDLKIVGIEPVRELREQGYKDGLSETELIEGNGLSTGLESKSFDIVCEFGVLHHVSKPHEMVAEMLRVSKVGVFISDCNNFGSGGAASRFLKQSINGLGLWRLYDFIRTGGKKYHSSEADGIFYSYSVFNNYKTIESACSRVHIINTKNSASNLYKSASHVALLGFK